MVGWSSCRYKTFTLCGVGNCSDVYVCPFGTPRKIDVNSLCDKMFQCEGGNSICERAASSSILGHAAQFQRSSLLLHCLPGLKLLVTSPIHVKARSFPYTVFLEQSQTSSIFLQVAQLVITFLGSNMFTSVA